MQVFELFEAKACPSGSEQGIQSDHDTMMKGPAYQSVYQLFTGVLFQ